MNGRMRARLLNTLGGRREHGGTWVSMGRHKGVGGGEGDYWETQGKHKKALAIMGSMKHGKHERAWGGTGKDEEAHWSIWSELCLWKISKS